jgi:hypothetical protein
MKFIIYFYCIFFFATHVNAQKINDSFDARKSLDKATDAIRDAFAKNDVELIAQLHSPEIIKYFGGNNVIIGRAALKKSLTDWFYSGSSLIT